MKNPFTNRNSPPLPNDPNTDISNGNENGSGYENSEKRRSSSFDESKVPWVTWRSLTLGAFVSIGGIIFGYDTGQISGFLEMKNFKERYAQLKPDGSYEFSNVRSGLIVSLVSFLFSSSPLLLSFILLAGWLAVTGSVQP